METFYIVVEVLTNLLMTYTIVLLGLAFVIGLIVTGILFLVSYAVAILFTQEEYIEDEEV